MTQRSTSSNGLGPARRGGVGRWGVRSLAALVLTSGCGELTSGGIGEVELEIVADSVTIAPATLAGTLTVGIQAFVQQGLRQIEITDGVQEVTLDLAGGSDRVVAVRTLPSGRYAQGRFVFRRVEAEVTGGLEVDGEPFQGAVKLALEPDEVVVIPWVTELNVPEDGVALLVLEMRASRWLRLLNRQLGEVTREAFEAHPPRVRLSPVPVP